MNIIDLHQNKEANRNQRTAMYISMDIKLNDYKVVKAGKFSPRI